MKLYRRRPWGVQGLLSDSVLTTFATKMRLKTKDDLIDPGGLEPSPCSTAW